MIIFPDGFEIERYGSASDTTNNAMELAAAVEALRYFKSPRHVTLVSDSAYLVNTLTQKWWREWERNGFIGRNGKTTPNKELWLDLIKMSHFHVLEMVKIKGHSGDPYNERCDKLAKRARKAAQLGVDPEIKRVNRISKRPSRRWQLEQRAKGHV